jgi:hypothetical protein
VNPDSQQTLPESFVALSRRPGQLKPDLSIGELVARHELCDDFAQMLTEPARAWISDLGLHETDVLARVQAGIRQTGLGLSEAEQHWVLLRLRGLLGWEAHHVPAANS